ncbi:VOC family protein [Flocculibacter collagenilyticus]|uniref:VOC family protein n=1 Tax=Flocculibacter collagenilyticus TaxID=2744479 RepID=UPI0018F78791|nr:VOC family protein [Flocculibacter collagenilyticus]
MEMVTNAINWFEIPVEDFNRAKQFYSKIFDFDMPEHEMEGMKMGFLLCEKEGVGGAIINDPNNKPCTEGTTIYLNGGKDLNTVLNRVQDAGGSVLMAKTQLPDEIGYIAMFTDTEGNRLGLHSHN